MSSQLSLPPFHLAFPVNDLIETRDFYVEILGCKEGRSSQSWIDFDLFGHQIVAHQISSVENRVQCNPVDGKEIPIPHFGLVLPWDSWHEMAEKLKKQAIEFVIDPYVRFVGEPGEQATMFFLDPSGNALEFKSFKDPSQIFVTS